METSDELAEEQRRQSDRFAELDKLRENVRGLAETLEERARSPTRVVGPTDGVEPLAPTDGTVGTPVTVKTELMGEQGTGLRPVADAFVPVGEVISQGIGWEQIEVPWTPISQLQEQLQDSVLFDRLPTIVAHRGTPTRQFVMLSI